MANNEEIRNDRGDSKKILTMIVLIATLMICTTSATYAYFAISATATNNMTGVASTASLTFSKTPTLIAPTNASYTSKPMVPQKSLVGTTNVLQKAFNGASGKDKCVDDNSNAICRAYQLQIKNGSSATVVIKGQIKFTYTGTGATFTNLKWKLMDSATAVTVASGNTGTASSTTFVDFATNISLTTNGTKDYYFIFWIEETDSSQNATDVGTWYATVQFINQVDGSGITSTITS